jgi:cytochrome c peroxidase
MSSRVRSSRNGGWARWLKTAIVLGTAVQVQAQTLTDAQRTEYRRPDTIPFPSDNPYTPAKASLGKALFFESRLSRDKNLNCASCHNPSFGGQVPFAQAIGAGGKPLGRASPTTYNQAWAHSFFWDGRAGSLEDQAKGPIQSAPEMDLPLTEAVKRLGEVEGYRKAFSVAFPQEGLTDKTILKAIATYERTIVTGDTAFDKWVRGDEDALPANAKRASRCSSARRIAARATAAGISPTTSSTTSACPPTTTDAPA